jgi:hypothetical protein
VELKEFDCDYPQDEQPTGLTKARSLGHYFNIIQHAHIIFVIPVICYELAF